MKWILVVVMLCSAGCSVGIGQRATRIEFEYRPSADGKFTAKVVTEVQF